MMIPLYQRHYSSHRNRKLSTPPQYGARQTYVLSQCLLLGVYLLSMSKEKSRKQYIKHQR